VLQQGENTFVFPDIIVPTAGFVDFRVVVEPRSADIFYQNNELSAFTEVTGPPRVLLVTMDEREVESLRTALEQTGLRVEVQGPHDLPLGLAPLSSYDCIVLANVPGTEITTDRMEYLQAYVSDLGGGLVAIGGPNSYGVGGYFETPIEETLPVEMRIKDQKRIPQMTMLFVIDRSGSMEIAGPSGVSNLELAKEAIIRSFGLLTDTDRVGVLSFDVNAYFVLEIQEVGDEVNREQMRATVGTLRPGGGMNIREGVLSADQVLRDDTSQIKHIILLTDGGSDPTGISAAVDRMYQNYGITTSVVAIGQDYAHWLQEVAMAGRGKFHLAYDVSTIPAIFTAETMLATRSYIIEEEFRPALTAQHPIMAGIDSTPTLQGYVATTAKETATVILRGPNDDPILAAWQYGLGRSVAFMSDATSRWAAHWIGWPGYVDFWSQAIRWTITEGSTSNVEARVVQRGEDAVLIVDARDNRGNYLNGLQFDASVINAQLNTDTLQLQQTAPGRYEAVFTPEQEGAYFITVAGQTPASADDMASQQAAQTTGWVLSYSAEYRVDVTGEDREQPLNLLKRVARITGGESLALGEERAKEAFLHNLNQEQAAQPIWPYFLLAALILLVFDVAVRRLVITSRDVENIRSKVAGWLGAGPQPALDPAAPAPHLQRLRGAKDRVRTVRGQSESTPTILSQPAEVARPPKKRARVPKAAPSVSGSTQAQQPSKQESPTQPPAGTLASRLLEQRRRASQEQDESQKE